MKAIFFVSMTLCTGLQALTQSLRMAPDRFSHITNGDPAVYHSALHDLQEGNPLPPNFFTVANLEFSLLSPSLITVRRGRLPHSKPVLSFVPFWVEALNYHNETVLLQLLKQWPLIPWETHQEESFLSLVAQTQLSERCVAAIAAHIRTERKNDPSLSNPFMTIDQKTQRLPIALVRPDNPNGVKDVFLRETNCPQHHNHRYYQMNARVLYARTLAAGMQCPPYDTHFRRNTSSREICLMFEACIDNALHSGFETYLHTLRPWTNRETVLRSTTILAYTAQALSKDETSKELRRITETARNILMAIFSTTAKGLKKEHLLATLHKQISALAEEAEPNPITHAQKDALLEALTIVSRDMQRLPNRV